MGAIVTSVVSWKVQAPAVLVPSAIAFVAFAIVYHEVKISAQIMLWVEAVSVSLISIVILIALWKRGLSIDPSQLHLTG
jgi:hypothetical protein